MSMQNDRQEILTNKVFEFVFGCAMHDATLQQAFKGKKDWVRKVTEAQSPLREYIDRLLTDGFASEDDHNDCFLKTANAICKSINDNKPEDAIGTFSFGNAQKLINMTVKHIYSICYYNPELRTKFEFCHCPLDGIMLDIVWKKVDAARKKALGKNFRAPWGCEGLSDDGSQPELKSFPDRYVAFQNVVKELAEKEHIYPIEYDYKNWES